MAAVSVASKDEASSVSSAQPAGNLESTQKIINRVWKELEKLKGEFILSEDTAGLRCTTLSLSAEMSVTQAAKEIIGQVTSDTGYATWKYAADSLAEREHIAPFRRLCLFEVAGMSPDGKNRYIRWYDGIPEKPASAPVLPERDLQELLNTIEAGAKEKGIERRNLYNEGVDGIFFLLPRIPAAEECSVPYAEPEDWDEVFLSILEHDYTFGYTAYDLQFFYTTKEEIVFFTYIK